MFLYGFSSCTCLYEWLTILVWVFVMHMFVRMTIDIIVAWVFVMYISVRLSIHILIGFVMYMFVRMTIHFFWMGFRHVHVYTNDYPFPCEWIFVMYISVLMTTHNFEWNVVFYISVRMTIFSFCMDFRHVHFCTDDYLLIRTEMYMTEIHSKWEGSHPYRNVHDEKSIQNEKVVIRTEMYMTKIHSKWRGSHPYKHVHDENTFKRNG